MTSFPALFRKACDVTLSPVERMHGLRGCAERFAPYGYHATWHHLILSAGIPQRLDDDPDSLGRAATELAEARDLWRSADLAFAARRRVEKAQGRRTPRKSDRWHSGPPAYCPDPEVHPHEPLPVVTRRVIDAYVSGGPWQTGCPVCGRARDATAGACPGCGVDPAGPRPDVPPATATTRASRWRQIWRRAIDRRRR